jgi:hypothetical protein
MSWPVAALMTRMSRSWRRALAIVIGARAAFSYGSVHWFGPTSDTG